MVNLTTDEAKRIIVYMVETSSPPAVFDNFPPMQQLQAIAGAIGIVDAMQRLGYRIIPPLQSVK